MSKQAQVGAFAIVALGLLLAVFYVLSNFAMRQGGYQLGVHFQSAAGLQSGATVLFSGVEVGTVDRVQLLPDDTIDVILTIKGHVGIPRDSRFLIQAALTGSPSLLIIPPRGMPQPYPTLAPGIATPISAQPQGSNVATISDLMQQGRDEIRRFDAMLDELQQREPRLLDTLQSALTNASEMSRALNADLGAAGANVAQLAQTLNSTMTLDAPQVDRMLVQLSESSIELNHSMAAVERLATDPQLRANLLATTANIAQTTRTLALLTSDLRTMTSSPQTQAQVRDTIANLDATMQRANSLLGRLGGRSHVYGVDAGATPLPVISAPPSGSSPGPLARPQRLAMGGTLAALARELVELQVRIGELDRQQVCCPSPLLSADRGPQTDVNAILLPHGSTSVMFGANDIGHTTTWNLAALHSVTPNLRLGGGILYSRLGVLGEFGANDTGVEARLYDPRRPTLDLYGEVHLTPWAQLFFGERAVNQPERRTEYGVQFHY